jgi:anti-sigma factor RsiW
MFERHVSSKLSAYLHGQLSEQEARRVTEHLSRCPECKQELEEISAGAGLAKNLGTASAPDALWSSIQRELAQARASSPLQRLRMAWMGWPRAPIAIAAALLITVGAAVAWYFELRQPLQVTVAATAPSEFEAAALRAYQSQSQVDWHWDLATHDARQLRDWLRLASNLHASLPDQRPLEDAGRLQLVGVKLMEAAGARTAVIGYQVDGRPVTLLTARVRDLHQNLGEGFLAKAIVYRAAQGDVKTFTWEASGQAYVMVSALPHFGERGCILCHTVPERRALIANMNPRVKQQ